MVWSSKAWCIYVQRVPAMLQILGTSVIGCPMNSCLLMSLLRACASKKYELSMSHGSDRTGVHVSSSLHSTNRCSMQSNGRAVWNLRLDINLNQALSPSFFFSLSLSLSFCVVGRNVLYMVIYSIPSPFYLTAAFGRSENSTRLLDSCYLQDTWSDSESCV